MTVLVKKVFISSKPSIVCLLCPPPCGPFSIQESAVGGLSYKVKKNVPWHILAPRRGCLGNHLPLRRVRIPVARFYFIGRIFLWNKKDPLKSGSDSLIIKSSYCSIASVPETGLLLAQAGTFRKYGVAVASQILCISTTLNKRRHNIEFSYQVLI